MQPDLFTASQPDARPDAIGKSTVVYVPSRSILTKGAGFLSAYDYSLNPYSGCTFACTYCYAAFFSRKRDERDQWGLWVKVKENAVALLQKKRRRPLDGKTIYMSSVTDAYQPIEKKLGLTRALLEELAAYHRPHLVVQTRSPLVTRDLDLFKKIGTVQINMTITTDSEAVRMAFEPACPANKVRLRAIREVREAGIEACITLTPLLPVENPATFADDLAGTGIQKFIIQPFHATKGKFVAGTRDAAMRIVEAYRWSPERYDEVHAVLMDKLPDLTEGQEGFAPPSF